MQYEGSIYRPPSEAHSLIVQATIGCSHNQCTFCGMYKDKRLRMRETQEVLRDLSEMAQAYPGVRRIFLADGDALILPTQKLLLLLEHIKQNFPACERVAVYGSPRSILLKSEGELRDLHAAGLGIVYLGLESGSDAILARISKGESASEIIEAGQRVKAAGIPLSVTAISGMGGAAHWREHAICTGQAFSAMKPDYIGLLTLMVESGTPLAADVESGAFLLLDAEGVALETLLMLEHMDCEGSVFRSNHASNYVSLRGTLNADKAAMIRKLKDALEGRIDYKKEIYRAL